MKIIFIRHGQAEHNRRLKFNETNNPPSQLTKIGVQQASKIANDLREWPIKRIYTSEIIRAKETAKIIQARHVNKKLVLKTDKRLNEFRSGYNNRLAIPWYLRILVASNKLQAKFNHGESIAESIERIDDFLKFANQEHKSETIAVVAHLHTYQALRHLIDGRPFKVNLRKNKLSTGKSYDFNL